MPGGGGRLFCVLAPVNCHAVILQGIKNKKYRIAKRHTYIIIVVVKQYN